MSLLILRPSQMVYNCGVDFSGASGVNHGEIGFVHVGCARGKQWKVDMYLYFWRSCLLGFY